MIIEYILSGVIIVQCIMHYIERKDLYTRLMCKDVQDYKSANKKEVQSPMSRHKEVLDRWRGKGEQRFSVVGRKPKAFDAVGRGGKE